MFLQSQAKARHLLTGDTPGAATILVGRQSDAARRGRVESPVQTKDADDDSR